MNIDIALQQALAIEDDPNPHRRLRRLRKLTATVALYGTEQEFLEYVRGRKDAP